MKKTLNVRIEVSRLEKLHEVAEERKKTMTQLIEDWIDRLPKPVGKDSAH
jgi:predicted DNA-binding ribbon-helix-helix protein